MTEESVILPPIYSPSLPANSSPIPEEPVQVYSVQLTDEQIKSIFDAQAESDNVSEATIMFNNKDSGEIRTVNGESLTFAARPIGDGADSPDVCFSKQNYSFRTVGCISAEIQVEDSINALNSATVGKRTFETTKAGTCRELQIIDDITIPTQQRNVRKKTVKKHPSPGATSTVFPSVDDEVT